MDVNEGKNTVSHALSPSIALPINQQILGHSQSYPDVRNTCKLESSLTQLLVVQWSLPNNMVWLSISGGGVGPRVTSVGPMGRAESSCSGTYCQLLLLL